MSTAGQADESSERASSASSPAGAEGRRTGSPRVGGHSVWWEAARPRTLPAAVAPVLVGTAAAATFDFWRFLLCLVVGLSLQVGVNYANDYFDGVRGVDTASRIGPRRAVASGRVSPAAMRGAMLVALGVAAAAGITLGALVGFELVVVGALAVLALVGYSGGPRPYASAGLGELFVFLFFGLVATAGSAYAQDDTLSAVALVAAFTPGLIAVALLVVNNLRDVVTDAEVGKRTLAVRVGDTRSRQLVAACIFAAFVPPVVTTGMVGSLWPVLPLAALPLAVRLVAAALTASRRALVGVLTGTGRVQLLVGVLFALGLWAA